MNGLVIEAYEDVAGKAVDEGGGRTRSIVPHHLPAHVGDFLSTDAWAYYALHGSESEVNDSPNFLESNKVPVVFDRHGSVPAKRGLSLTQIRTLGQHLAHAFFSLAGVSY
jgi:hypothetical protein